MFMVNVTDLDLIGTNLNHIFSIKIGETLYLSVQNHGFGEFYLLAEVCVIRKGDASVALTLINPKMWLAK